MPVPGQETLTLTLLHQLSNGTYLQLPSEVRGLRKQRAPLVLPLVQAALGRVR